MASLGLTLVVASRPITAQVMVHTADCGQLKLKEAEGVPAMAVHVYRFDGTCRVMQHHAGAVTPGQVFPAKGYARWDADSGTYHEVLELVSGVVLTTNALKKQVVTGKVVSRFTCGSDPLISRTSCRGTFHVNPTGWDSLSAWYRADRPMLRGLTTLTQATALSPTVVPPQADGPPGGVAVATSRPVPGPLPRTAGAGAALADGTALRFRTIGRVQRWVLEDVQGKVLRVFPAGATAAVDRAGVVHVTAGRDITAVGRVRPGSR